MLSCMIDTMEGWYVATSDITGCLLQTGYDKGDINNNMEVAMVTLLEYIDTAYYRYFIYIYMPRKIHVWRIQERYTQHPRGISTLLQNFSKGL